MYCSLQNLFHILSVFYSTNFVGVIIPGYNVKPESYSGLASSIVSTMEESNIGMDVYTANVTYHTQENYNTALDNIFDYVRRAYNNVSIVAITHSAGMYFGEEYCVKYANYTIQMGSVLNSAGKLFWGKNSLFSYPRPILTLLGENDGFLKWPLAHYEFENIKSLPEIYTNKYKPVIILEDINRMDMADGKLTDSAKSRNITEMTSKMSLSNAHNLIASVIKKFLTFDQTFISKKVAQTREKLSNFSKLNPLQIVFQKLIDNITNVYEVNNENFLHFLYSKPNYLGNSVFIQTYYNITDRYHFKNHLWLKMKHNGNAPNITAKDFNKLTFTYVYSMLSGKQKKTYEEFGKKLLFGEDIISYKNWLTDSINVLYSKSNVTIKSPILITNTTSLEPRYQNMFYVKVLSPQQIYEWIVCESLK